MRPLRRAENSAVLFVPNVSLRMLAKKYISPLSLHGLLLESFTIYIKFCILEDKKLSINVVWNIYVCHTKNRQMFV